MAIMKRKVGWKSRKVTQADGSRYIVMSDSSEAVALRCSVKNLFLEISQNSQENICARVSFLIKLQAEAERSCRTPLEAASDKLQCFASWITFLLSLLWWNLQIINSVKGVEITAGHRTWPATLYFMSL